MFQVGLSLNDAKFIFDKDKLIYLTFGGIGGDLEILNPKVLNPFILNIPVSTHLFLLMFLIFSFNLGRRSE